MANMCYFILKAVGKKKDLNEFNTIIGNIDEGNTSKNRHFFCVNCPNLTTLEIINKAKNDNSITEVIFSGFCNWSIYDSMCKGIGTYYNRSNSIMKTNLEDISKELNLEIEAFSEEPGCAIQEHMLFIKGDWLINDCIDYQKNKKEIKDWGIFSINKNDY